jgi:hypothetical protein
MTITSKALQGLIDEIEASRPFRANVPGKSSKEIRWVLKSTVQIVKQTDVHVWK